MTWFTYILRCNDQTLYTGITTDISRRLSEHNTGTKAAKYTRSRKPLTLVYVETHDTQGEALTREAHIKKLKRTEKEMLIENSIGLIPNFAKTET